MKKVRFGLGGIVMMAAMLVSDSGALILIYVLAAALHEAGHLLAAKILKVGVSEIKFGFSGVRIVTDERLTSYRREIILALAGPVTNLLALLFSLTVFRIRGEGFLTLLTLGSEMLLSGEGNLYGALSFFALSSLVQAAVNLLPVKTFDGGRVLYCLAAELLGENVAERIIDVTTAFSAFVLWTLALYLMLRVSSGLGIYVFSAFIFASVIMGNDR